MFKWFARSEVEKNILSPDGNIRCVFTLKSGKIFYSVYKNGKPVVKPSRLGFKIFGEEPLVDGFKLIRTHNKISKDIIEMLWGEDRFINNDYIESSFYLTEKSSTGRIMTLRFRVFNDSVAFRYEIPPQPKFRRISIEDELTEFNIDLNSKAWQIPAYQPDRYEYNYEESTVYALTSSVHTPLTLHTQNGFYVAIHEAALYNYGSMTIKLSNNVLKTDITPLSDGSKAHVDLPFQTPWRLIMLADSAIELTKNRTMYALNDPPETDFSWVKTLKFIGIWWAMYVGEWTWAPGDRHGATTEHAKQ